MHKLIRHGSEETGENYDIESVSNWVGPGWQVTSFGQLEGRGK